MNEMERLSIEAAAFENTRASFNEQLEGLVVAMNKKGFSEGTITMKVNISLKQIAAIDPDTGELANIYKPYLRTKVTSKVSAKAEAATEENTDEISIAPDENGIPVFKSVEKAQTSMNI